MSHLNGNDGWSGGNGVGGTPMDELIAGRALGDLTRDEAAMLGASWGEGEGGEEFGFEAAAGSLFLAMAGGGGAAGVIEPVPDDVMARLRKLAEAYIAARAVPSRVEEAGPPGRRGTATAGAVAGIVARLEPRRVNWWGVGVAASLVLAASGWFVALQPKAGQSEPGPSQVRAMVLERPDVVTISWGEWSDESVTAEVRGVGGDVVWSDQAQSGVLCFRDLPRLEDAVYQLWIIDAEWGMSQRVSGAIFQGGTGQTLVTIHPEIRISRAAAFAVTIEQPGGTWVSDMTRRVVIAARPG